MTEQWELKMNTDDVIGISREDLDYIYDTLYTVDRRGYQTDTRDEVKKSLELIDEAFKLDRNK